MPELVLGLPEQMVEATVRIRRDGEEMPNAEWRMANEETDKVVVAGMGGSAIGGDILRCLLADKCPTPVLVVRDYSLPAAVNRRTLFIAVSYSGNTEETLSSFRQARRRGCRIVAITSGGKLKRAASRFGLPLVEIPGGLPPRAALGYLFVSLLTVVERLGLARGFGKDLNEATSLMVERRKQWLCRARAIARKLEGRLPVVYSTSRLLDAVADRWRCQLNENAEVMCHTNVFPEHNHNEIVGMGAPDFLAGRTALLVLLDRTTHPRTRLRLGHVLSITKAGYATAFRLETEGRSALARIFSMVMLGDLVSVELARLRGVDPTPIPRIDELKRRMAQEKSRAKCQEPKGRGAGR